MMVGDSSESGLERLICTALAGHPCDLSPTFPAAERQADNAAKLLESNKDRSSAA